MSEPRTRAAGALRILVIGDASVGDAARDALATCQRTPQMVHALDSSAAAAQLWPPGAAPGCDLILLDAGGEGALELLARLKTDPSRRHVPVLALCAEAASGRLLECWRRDANACLEVAASPGALAALLVDVARFWLEGSVLLAPPVKHFA